METMDVRRLSCMLKQVHAPELCAPCREEAYCRFCELQLPDWAEAYKSMPKGDPRLSVSHEGTVYLINGKQHQSISLYSRTLSSVRWNMAYLLTFCAGHNANSDDTEN